MSDLDDRSGGRRKGLFRRSRVEEFPPSAPWEPGEWNESSDDVAIEDPSSDTSASDTGRRRTSADMFAQRDRGWSESWGDDAWDDEWRDPALRRVSIPAAASPGPAEVDAWLSDDAEGWSDVTRETAQRWGGSHGTDTSGERSANEQAPTPIASGAVGRLMSDDPVERALATVEHQSIDLTDGPDADAAVLRALPDEPESTGRFDPKPVPRPEPRSRFRRTRTSSATVHPAPEHDALESISIVETSDSWDDATGPISNLDISSLDTVDTAIDDSAAVSPLSGEGDVDDSASDDVSERDGDGWNENDGDSDEVGTSASAAGRRPGQREAAFSDRATWIGAGVAILASINLVLSVASGMRAADPGGSSLSIFTRIGRGMAQLGITQAALLVLAVVLISLPTLVDARSAHRYDGRVATGLGLTLGGAVVGVLGSLLAWAAQRRLADLAGTNGGSTSTRLFSELVVTAGLCLVAFAASLRALRSIHD